MLNECLGDVKKFQINATNNFCKNTKTGVGVRSDPPSRMEYGQPQKSFKLDYS